MDSKDAYNRLCLSINHIIHAIATNPFSVENAIRKHALQSSCTKTSETDSIWQKQNTRNGSTDRTKPGWLAIDTDKHLFHVIISSHVDRKEPTQLSTTRCDTPTQTQPTNKPICRPSYNNNDDNRPATSRLMSHQVQNNHNHIMYNKNMKRAHSSRGDRREVGPHQRTF